MGCLSCVVECKVSCWSLLFVVVCCSLCVVSCFWRRLVGRSLVVTLLVVGCSLRVGGSLLVVCCSLLVVGCRLFVVGCCVVCVWLSFDGYSLLVVV